MAPRRAPDRDDDLTSRADEDKLLDLYKDVSKGYEAQRDRSNEIKDNWDIYNCVLTDKQFYNGTSKIALPFIHDAVEARVTRFCNQVFPTSGRYVEVTTGEADPPQATQALIEAYVRKSKLRTQVVPTLFRNGDVEGTWNLYVSWKETKRSVTSREMVQPKTDGMDNMAAEPVEDIQEQEVIDSFPDVEVLSDVDTLILPATSNSVEEALENGGSVTVIRRWSKGKIRKLMREEEIREEQGQRILDEMSNQRASNDIDISKAQLDAAGVKERGKIALIYETWTMLKIGKEHWLCRIYYGGEDIILGVKRCPFWNDRCPILIAPASQNSGGVKSSKAVVSYAFDLQILANDTINEAADTSHFSAMPIVMSDPLKNPRIETMTLGLAAVWETSPSDTEIVTFPELWKNGLDRAAAIKEQIFQTLNVNPSMIPQSTGGQAKKRNQAELATEQQVDILTTADVVTTFEEATATPLVQRFAEYDHQFRDEAITVKVYGEMGLRANMEKVEPIQLNERFEFRWFGVEAARNAAQMQQQIAWINVVKGLGPQTYPDYELNLAPLIVQGTENVFGPRLAPLVFKKKTLITVDPMIENDMLQHGFPVQTHPGDDDQQHMAVHMMLLQSGGDPHGNVQAHIQQHMQQMQAKAAAQMQPQQGQGGGGGGMPGGGPRPGAQPAPQRPAQQPAGAVHKDRMGAAGVVTMPRKAG